MNILLIVRSEIMAIFILLFLIWYNEICARYREGKNFFPGVAYTAMGHAILCLITEITVNQEGFPVLWDNMLHILLYSFALLFSLKYFEYVLSLIVLKNKASYFLRIAYVISVICLIVMVFSPIHYIRGNGTCYSVGIGSLLCYALGYLLMVLSDVVMIIYRKKINTSTVLLLIPISLLGLAFLAIQIVVPEFLFTGCALSIISLGVFFASENPVEKFQNRSFIDFDTQTWNKNCYEYDLANSIKNRINHESMIYVLADINGLKTVNDNYGHLEGDALIRACADSLTSHMSHAYKVYRIGGDEFAVIYLDIPIDVVKKEIEEVYRSCEEKSEQYCFKVSVAMGYGQLHQGEKVEDVVRRADQMMYVDKDDDYRRNGLERRK